MSGSWAFALRPTPPPAGLSILGLTSAGYSLGPWQEMGGVRPSAVLSLLEPQAAFLAMALSLQPPAGSSSSSWPWLPQVTFDQGRWLLAVI